MIAMESVDILLSVYNPNEKYLIEQLKSINNQDYPNIKIIIFDDCIEQRTDRNIFNKYITHFTIEFLPYEEHNLGYTRAFERLVRCSKGDYIAFCDQDDVWHTDKISKSVKTLKKDHSLLVASDRRIINQNDDIVVQSVRSTSHNKQNTWHTGDDIAKYNIFTTFAPGMAMVLNGNFARSIVPFSTHTGHDKWVLCCASIEGTVSFIDEALVDYRRHDHNVSGVLNDVKTKKDYYQNRVIPHDLLIKDLLKKYPDYKDKEEVIMFSQARMKHSVMQLKKYSYLAPDTAKFEILLAMIPSFLFKPFRYCIRKIM